MIRPKRKNIPLKVKAAVRARQKERCAECGEPFAAEDPVQFDHRPAIWERMVNVDGTDYHPPQNDPDFIEALHKPCHLKRTVGRLPGAEKTATTKGSDAWRAKKFRKLEGKNKPRKRVKIQSRGFSKQKRGFRS